MNNWISTLEKEPSNDGIYYIYVSDNQTGDEIKKVNYENGIWKIELDDNSSILAWKKIESKKIKNKERWLIDHKKEIKDCFQLKILKIHYFEIAETLVECICEYSWFMNCGLVHYIDGVYVIKILY